MSTNSGGNRRIVKNTGLLYIRMLFVMCITLFTTRIVLKALGVVDYGVYNVIAGFIALFTVLNNSLTTGTNRFYNYAIGQKIIIECSRYIMLHCVYSYCLLLY